ncbi:MAG: DUF2124 family protein [Candidatus Bathyarchaeia archaeon]
MKKEIVLTEEGLVGFIEAFSEVAKKSNLTKGDVVIFSGCPGTCFPTASNFAFAIQDLGPVMYWVPDADLREARKLEMVENVGIQAGGKEELPGKAKLVLLTPGLLAIDFENIEKMLQEALGKDGKLVGETPIPNFFRDVGWEGRLPFNYIIELGLSKVEVFELKK